MKCFDFKESQSPSHSQQVDKESLSQFQQLLEEPSTAASKNLFDKVFCSLLLAKSGVVKVSEGRKSSQDKQEVSSQLSFSSEASTVILVVKIEPPL